MASKPTLFIFCLIISLGIYALAFGETVTPNPGEPVDSTRLDTLQIIDTTRALGIDTLKLDTLGVGLPDSLKPKPVVLPTESGVAPYYNSYLSGKGLGDYLWYCPGVVSLQHGSEGQPELLVKSIVLGGLDVTYNNLPVFQQGFYVPYRSGADLNTLMFENVADIKITSLSYLTLFSQGEVLSLKSMMWPSQSNPSSVTMARGPNGYSRTAWRFSRILTENVAGTFNVGFKSGDGYYITGADYDGFSVSGSIAAKPRQNAEVDYTFYLNKAKQGVLQFDRVIPSNWRLNRDINFHSIAGKYQMTETKRLDFNLFYQKNYNHVFSDDKTYQSHINDFVSGVEGSFLEGYGKHNLKISGGAQHYKIGGLGTNKAKLLMLGAMANDSIIIDDKQEITFSMRARHRSIGKLGGSATVDYRRKLNEKTNLNLLGGLLDFTPDIYSMYYSIPPLRTDIIGAIQINSYTYRSDAELNPKKTMFVSAGMKRNLSDSLNYSGNITIERVTDDILQQTIDSNATWYTKPINIAYKRVTLTSQLSYSISKYFIGNTGLTVFGYSRQKAAPGYKHSPALSAFTSGQFVLKEVLRDIDLMSVYQIRYISQRNYKGFVEKSYKQAVSVDGHLGVRFGVVTFRLVGTNLMDFITGNTYSVWGEYDMPPGSVWWILTWDLSN